MIAFMIDLENTNSPGMKGAEYLCPQDRVTVFFSANSKNMEYGLLQKLFDSGCQLELCKLVRPSRNALDLYIASRIGELYGGGYQGDVAIVSNDKDFQAVHDYWEQCAKPGRRVIVRPSIAQSIVSLNEHSKRRKRIQQAVQTVNLEEEYGRYQARLQTRQGLEQAFAGTEYLNRLNAIMGLMADCGAAGRKTYLAALKLFGRKGGLEVYRRLKAMAEAEENCGA